ncbi:F-box protein At1g61340-like [Primulina huaijiensis]|uniref:F-box protein At1g61340-like n=1 Tax=Primulina huaijiensis TaxID=1492673 RepID=UPI003CC74DA7
MAIGINSGAYLNDGHVIGMVRSTSFGRKRVALTNNGLELGDGDNHFFCTFSKRHCYQDSFLPVENSALEALPQDILIRILCGVEHDDLKRLFFVSKTIRETTVIVKQTHFAYSTPMKTVGFQKVDIFGNFDEGQASNAPKQLRARQSRLTEKKLAGISVALFFSDEEDGWSRKDSFVEMMETEET